MRKRVGLLAVLVMLIFAMTGCAKLLSGPEDTNPYLNLFLIAADTGEYDIFLDQCTPGLREKMNDQAIADISTFSIWIY